MLDSDLADVVLSRFSVEIKTISLVLKNLSITFYPHYFVLSIISNNKINNIGLII